MTDTSSKNNKNSAPQLQLMPRLQREFNTISLMVRLYCNDHHNTTKGLLCHKCSDLIKYAGKRLCHCPFQSNKPTCGKCTVHCYKKEMQNQVIEIMRYSGPKMMWHHPLVAIRHLFDSTRRPLTLPRSKK